MGKNQKKCGSYRAIALCFVVVLGLVVVGGGRAARSQPQSLTVLSFNILAMAETDGSGALLNLVREVARRAGISVSFQVSPAARVLQNYEKGEGDAVMPIVAPRLPEMAGKYGEAVLFFQKREFVFVRQGTAPPATLADLHGKMVGVTTGYRYGGGLREDRKIQFDEVPSDITSIRKLAAGRIDAFVADEFAGAKAIRETGVSNVIFNPATPLSVTDTYILLRAIPQAADLAARLRQAVDEVRADGTYDRLFAQ